MEIYPIDQTTAHQTDPSFDPDPKTGLLIYRSIVVIGYILNAMGVVLGITCGLFGSDPRPDARHIDSLLMIVSCSYLVMLIAVYALFRGIFFMGISNGKGTGRTFFWGLAAASIGMFFITTQYHCVIDSHAYTYIWTGVLATFTLVILMRFLFVLKNENALTIFLSQLIPLFLFFQTLFICFNATGTDHVTRCKVAVLKKSIRSGKKDSYSVSLDPIGSSFAARKWQISYNKYLRIHPGDSIDIQLRSGSLGSFWFYNADLNKY